MAYEEKPFLDYNQIQSGIFLGNLISSKNEELLEKLKIKAILTVDIYPIPDSIIKKLKHYLHIKLRDDENEDLISNLESTYLFIQKCLDEKLNIFIHCVAGLSRSPSVLIGYLMKANKLTFNQAFELVSKKRDKICCNKGFKKQLILYSEMNYKLNYNYRPFRIHQLKILSHSVNFYLLDIINPINANKLKNLINNYLTKFHDNNNLNGGKIVFKCKKCRFYLFNDLNILTNSLINQSSNLILSNSNEFYMNFINGDCGNIYIEPLTWMSQEITSTSGLLLCKCFNLIGKFNWKGIDCSIDCTKHIKIVPSFKINAKKVDHHIL